MKTDARPNGMLIVRRAPGERLSFAREYLAWLDHSARCADIKLSAARTDREAEEASRELIDVARRRVAFQRKEPKYGT